MIHMIGYPFKKYDHGVYARLANPEWTHIAFLRIFVRAPASLGARPRFSRTFTGRERRYPAFLRDNEPVL